MSNGKSKNLPGKNMPAKGPSLPASKPADTRPAATPAGKPATSAAQSASTAKTTVPAQPVAPVHVAPLYRRIDWMSFIVTFVVVLAGYLWTLAPDLTLEDCGELATGSYYAGVPHPPGYPVWTVYSWIFTWLVPIGNIAYRVAISSAFAGALACGLVALMVSRGSSMIMEGIAELRNIEKRFENALCLVCGFVAGVVIGFNGFMWSQAVIVEVYTLSALSMTGVLACMLRWIYAPHQRRYLYMAFFWFGICFNNHQSLIVIVLGMEISVYFAAPRLARNLFFWNTVCYLGGLFLMGQDMVSTLSENPPLQLIYHLIGIGSFILWVSLLVSTRITGMEFLRDFLIVVTVAYLGLLFLCVTNFVTSFEYRRGLFVAFNMLGLGLLGVTGWIITRTWTLPREWLPALGCGGAFAFGAAFYVFMPLASMSNPPLNWGYARTVQGFFHAFTRGQYERIHPTTEVGRYIDQVQLYVGGAFEEMNFVYVLIGLVPLFFVRKMQARERAWIFGLAATYVTLSALLLWLLNPAPDRQSRDLNRVFFTASHFIIAMGFGYGLAILGGYLSLHYQRFRHFCLIGSLGAALVALFMLAVRFSGVSLYQSLVLDLDSSYNPIVRFTAVFSLCLALAAVAMFFLCRTQLPRIAFLAVLWVLPAWSVLSHWYDNEQRGHYFGYWFGHDMFTPPFYDPQTKQLSYDPKRRQELLASPDTARSVYPEMDRDTVLYGGTDPGRFNPTYMIFCESFIPPSKRNPQDPQFDRRDVYLITQNALADGTYLNYIRAQFNRTAQVDPPFFSELFRGPKETSNLLETPNHTNIIARMMRPLDHFFLDLGYNIEESRRTKTSFFTEKDFTNLPGLTGKLKAASDPVSKFLFENLSKETQQLLTSGNESSLRAALATDLSHLIRRDLDAWKELATLQDQKVGLTNAIAGAKAELAGAPNGDNAEKLKSRIAKWESTLAPIDKEIAKFEAIPSLYESNRFAGVQLTARTKRFIKENPRSHTRIRLNRILLEEAYPNELARSPGGVYPDIEILSASNDDSQRCFQEYLADAQKRLDHDRRYPNEPRQLRPGEDVQIKDNKVQVSGQVAVMAINGLLTKVIFDKNPDHEFYVEESFPLDWMYPHLSPFGIIMKINRKELPEITEDMVYRDHEFWSQFSTRLIGNWIEYDTPVAKICEFADEAYYKHRVPQKFTGDRRFLRDSDGQKAFSKLRSSIAGVYNWRIANAKTPQEQQRMIREADFAFKQAYAFCPYSPEAIFRYVNLLVQLQRYQDALLIANTSFKLDPFNAQIENLIVELTRIQGQVTRASLQQPAAPAVPQEQINALDAQFKAQPDNLETGMRLATLCLQAQQFPKAVDALDRVLTNPAADANMMTIAANYYAQMGAVAKTENALQLLVKKIPDNPEGRFDLAAVLAYQNKSTQALEALSNALQQNAARLSRDAAAPNLYPTATTDSRLASLRGLPEFQRLMEAFKPK